MNKRLVRSPLPSIMSQASEFGTFRPHQKSCCKQFSRSKCKIAFNPMSIKFRADCDRPQSSKFKGAIVMFLAAAIALTTQIELQQVVIN